MKRTKPQLIKELKELEKNYNELNEERLDLLDAHEGEKRYLRRQSRIYQVWMYVAWILLTCGFIGWAI